ncbi:hypothetical protein JCM8097_005899 [Rhodosporidiobolus ruineniae]
MTTSPAPRPAPYRLSAVLGLDGGHTDDVRSLAAVSSLSSSAGPTSTSSAARLLSGSRDKTARLWDRTGGDTHGAPSAGWSEKGRWSDEGWVNAVGFLPAREDEADKGGYLVATGADALIHLFPLSSASLPPSPAPEPAHTLAGHAHNVCALRCSSDGRRIVSASWDCTARVWEWGEKAAVEGEEGGEGKDGGWECKHVLVGHEAAVWDVLLFEKERDYVLTACADSKLRLFDRASQKHLFRGHTGPVRTLAKLLPSDPSCALFASASNDCTIRIWNYQSGDAVTVLGQHESFVYSICSLPSACGGGLASAGEDGVVKVWNEEDGEEDQVLQLPALSVWSLAALPNGDLACGCSDNLIWIFTRDETRNADEATEEEFEGRMAELRALRAVKDAVPNVQDEKALETEGEKEGEVKLVRKAQQVVAYRWEDSTWVELGEVVDSSAPAASTPAPPPRMEHDGQTYDYVFSIDVKDDEPPLPLPYNLDEDPHAVAEAFVKEHTLPESYLEQIVQFIRASTA